MPSTDTKDRPYWVVGAPLPAPMLTMMAKQAEEMGMEGMFGVQVHGAPFTTLAAAAMVTERIKLGTGIAIASVRSPFETAMTAMDVDRISNGRFVLGLGASASSWTEGLYGVPYAKPLTQLKETVRAVRYIIANAHKGLDVPFEGEYYKADFHEFQVTQEPVREEIPIWTAALRKRAVRAAGEVADGVMGHPIWSLDWAEKLIEEELPKGLKVSGRSRSDIHVNLWIWTAIADTMEKAIEDSRGTVAFYGGVGMYEPFFAEHGFGDIAKKLNERILEGDLAGASKLVPDEMVRAFVACGTKDDVNEYLERAWKTADSICVVPPTWGVDTETLMAYQMTLAELLMAR